VQRASVKRVLLVYPEFPNTYWSFRYALPFGGKRSAFPPLGLMTIASMLPPTWEKRLVDLNVRPLRDADLRWADEVWASAMIVQKESLYTVVDRAKALGKTVVVGGPYVSTDSNEFLNADHIFMGEAETTLPQYLADLELGTPRRIYQSAQKPDVTVTPLPDFSLVDLSKYSAMSIQYSRGCPFNCEFCDIIEIYGRVPRTKTNAQTLAELDALYDAGWRGPLFIVDDNFIGNKKNVRQLMPALVEWMEGHRYPFTLFTEASVNLADDEPLLELMRRANFQKVFLGIETPVEESLKETQKLQNTRRSLLDSVRRIQSYGMEVMAGFIVGFDNDPADVFQRQIEFIRQSAIPLAMVGLLNALPETQLWRRLKAEGRLLAESTGNNLDTVLNFVPKMDPQALVEGYKKILLTIYKPAEFYERACESLRQTRAIELFQSQRLTPQNLMTIIRIVVKLGVVDDARRDFWRFFRRSYFHRLGHLGQVLTFAAFGYHFRKITEQYS
jgi:radical SAM superfamily enzyme YgiQ (UPF0313 family)